MTNLNCKSVDLHANVYIRHHCMYLEDFQCVHTIINSVTKTVFLGCQANIINMDYKQLDVCPLWCKTDDLIKIQMN